MLALRNLEKRVALLEKKPKDAWDKLASFSGLATGLATALIAAVGLLATHIFNTRSKIIEAARDARAAQLSRVDTVNKFLPYLTAADPSSQRAAFAAISALGDDNLAVSLAESIRGAGAVRALMRIGSKGGEAGQLVVMALLAMFADIVGRTTAIRLGGQHVATGFLVDNGLLVTYGRGLPGDADTAANGRLTYGMLDNPVANMRRLNPPQGGGEVAVFAVGMGGRGHLNRRTRSADDGEKLHVFGRDARGNPMVDLVTHTPAGLIGEFLGAADEGGISPAVGSPIVDAQGDWLGLLGEQHGGYWRIIAYDDVHAAVRRPNAATGTGSVNQDDRRERLAMD